MVQQLQQNQRAWLEAQQRMQEEIMVRNQKAQKEILDAVVSASRASVELPPPIASESKRISKAYLAETLKRGWHQKLPGYV